MGGAHLMEQAVAMRQKLPSFCM